jgi:hypothetical protein
MKVLPAPWSWRKFLVVSSKSYKEGDSMDPAPQSASESGAPHHPVLRAGILVGIGLCILSGTWLLVANRVPFLDRFAVARNLAAAAVAGILLLVPVCRFRKSPGQLFLSGLIAWTMLTLGYGAMATQFPALDERLGAFHLFVLGVVVYGLVAAIAWVTQLVIHLCLQPAPVTRRRLP